MKPKPIPKITKAQLAFVAGVSRQSVAKYLAQPEAPKPDKAGRYPAVRAAFYVGQSFARNTEAPELGLMRQKKLKLELAVLERADLKARGRLIDVATIEPAILAAMNWWTSQMQSVWEHELPPKYEARTTIERRQLNADAVDRLLRGFKEGLEKVATGAETGLKPTAA